MGPNVTVEGVFRAPSAAFTARPKAADGMVFTKEVLYEGSFIHPANGKTYTFTRAELEAMAAQTNLLLSRGVSVPFPDGHRFDVKDNLGFWSKFSVADSQSRPGSAGLYGEVHVPLEKVAERMGKTITEVSIYAEREAKLTDGTVIAGPVITHVAATNYPVIPGQNNFVASFSKTGEDKREVPVYDFSSGPKEPVINMDKFIETVLAAFGLTKTTPLAEMEAKFADVKAKLAEHTALSAQCEKLKTDIVTLGKTGPTGASEPAKSDREKALEAELAKVHSERRKAVLDAALSAGRISKPEHEAFSKLVAIGETAVIPFGASAAERLDVEKVVFGLIEARKPNAAFSTAPTARAVAADASEKAAAELAQRKLSADWFSRNGYEVKWNAAGTDFTATPKQPGN